MLSDDRIRELMLAHGFTVKDGLTDLKPYVYAASRAIESAAVAERDARTAEMERQMDVMAKNTEAQAHASVMREIELTEKVEKLEQQLEEARKDAKTFTEEQIDAAVKAWFAEKIIPGRYPFSKRMRAAIAAAIKEQT